MGSAAKRGTMLWRYWITSKTFAIIKLASLPIEEKKKEIEKRDIVSLLSLSDNYVLYIKFN